MRKVAGNGLGCTVEPLFGSGTSLWDAQWDHLLGHHNSDPRGDLRGG